MPTINLITLGCPKNTVDSRAQAPPPPAQRLRPLGRRGRRRHHRRQHLRIHRTSQRRINSNRDGRRRIQKKRTLSRRHRHGLPGRAIPNRIGNRTRRSRPDRGPCWRTRHCRTLRSPVGHIAPYTPFEMQKRVIYSPQNTWRTCESRTDATEHVHFAPSRAFAEKTKAKTWTASSPKPIAWSATACAKSPSSPRTPCDMAQTCTANPG